MYPVKACQVVTMYTTLSIDCDCHHLSAHFLNLNTYVYIKIHILLKFIIAYVFLLFSAFIPGPKSEDDSVTKFY
jgi:hypothetical protein